MAKIDRELGVVEKIVPQTIDVENYSPTINEDDLEKVTEPFFRTGQSRSRKSGGFGLGLYLSKQIITAHSGTIQIKNHSQQGAVVDLILPIKQK